MVKRFRDWLTTTAGKIVVVVIMVPVIAAAVYSMRSFFHGSTPDFANYSMFICSETGKTFRHRNVEGDHIPMMSPFSGKETAVPAEACYWTRDGGTKTDPTWVLVNEYIHKSGPTFCPDCGRLVVGHNPAPRPGMKPPPTEEGYNARNGG